MATFSLGTSGVAPGAPGVYINEQAGRIANANLADFSTVYMLVETDEDVPVTRFPFNTPIPITSLNDYKALIRVGTSTVPEGRIPLLSYNCVNEFFQNAQVGDLRVVRVGTPNQIVEIELLPSSTKINSSTAPSALTAGNVVYVQMIINGLKLVAGDGSTGYTSGGEWLGVPVTIPATYVAGDEANNRKISEAMRLAVAEAIESNPAVRSSVYVRDSGLVNDIDPASNSENGFVSIASTTFNGNVSVVTQVLPVGSNFVFMQNAYDIENIVGGAVVLERVPQDYTQCITTAFDGQQDQGYLITPTAYAQFDAKGRALVGATAAAHCASNNFKWMALADPGPYLITDVNKYQDFVPHKPAADLITGLQYLVDNAIYEWIGEDVTYNRLENQSIVAGGGPAIAVAESANLVAAGVQVGLLDPGQYTATSAVGSSFGRFPLDTDQNWPVTLPIQQVTLTEAGGAGNDFQSVDIQGGASGVNLNGTEVYVVAPPADVAVSGSYSLNVVYLATNAADAATIYNAVVLAGGSSKMGATVPNGAVKVAAPSGSTCLLTYADPYWDLPVDINGQTSDLIENTTDSDQGVNTLHLPGTLQAPTETYRLDWVSRTIFDANTSVATYGGTSAQFAGAAEFTVFGHGLVSGQRVYFTQPIVTTQVAPPNAKVNLVKATNKLVSNAYWVKVVDSDHFVLAKSLANYSGGSFISIGSGYAVDSLPTIFYTEVLGRGLDVVSSTSLLTLPMIRGRKYEFQTSFIFDEACAAAFPVAPAADQPRTSIYLNNNAVILGAEQINPYGEDLTAPTQCGFLPKLNLISPDPTPTSTTENAFCVPTVDQFFQPEAYLVPSIDAILGGDYDASGAGAVSSVTAYSSAAGLNNGDNNTQIEAIKSRLVGVYFIATVAGNTPDGASAVAVGDRVGLTYNGSSYEWAVIVPDADGGDLTEIGQTCYQSQVELVFTPEQAVPAELWRFDAVTSTEIIDQALRGVGFNGVPQAEFIDAGVDNVNRLLDDSQRYFNPFGFIAYYGPYIENGAGQFIPPSPYVTGVALRRYRAEGYQFPPAGVKYQLADAQAVQIPINSAQQNLLNPKGCNAVRTLPGYPQTAVFIWGGRTRVNEADAQQRLYQFVNTRVILNVVYGSLRNAFDTQIFNVIDGFGVVFNQIVSVGNSVLNQLYVRGALFGAKPSQAFQVICDNRINSPEDLENGIVNAKVFVTPVPTLERIQIDLIRVAIGKMQQELDIQGLGQNNQ